MVKVKELGERKLIEHIHELVSKYWNSKPIYDDAYFFWVDYSAHFIFHTDVLNYSTDYIEGMGFYNFGWKAVICNLSDIACKGGDPEGMLFSISIPEDMEFSDFDELIRGILDALKKHNCRYLGGDLSSSRELSIAGFAYGKASKILPRAGAKENYLIGLTGKFGLTSLAYKILFEKWDVPEPLRQRALDSVLKPKGRIREAQMISDFVENCMDISDGLATSLHLFAEANNMGIEVNKIPIDEEVWDYCRNKGIDPYSFALYEGGEEYELLFAFRYDWEDMIRRILLRLGCWFTVIGRFTTKRKGVYYKGKDKKFEIEKRGWEHFKYWK